MSAARTRLSIDLGTLRTSAALQQGDASPTIVALGPGNAVSSTVAVEGGHVVIGDAAEAVIAMHPERGVRELKRRFGDTTPVVLDGQASTADALTADVLAAVATAAGVDPSSTAVVLTHPAGWHEYKRELLEATGTRAGFAEVETISEPEAAVRPFVRSGRLAGGSTVAVYDLGGTFEVSIVGITESGVRVLGQPQTLERLGGDVLDQVVFRHVTEALGGTLQQLDRNDPTVRSAVAALRSECAAAKERLSSDGETSIPVVAPGLDTRVRITRDEFETAVRPLVTDTLAALDRALASAGIAATDLAAVVLAGGGSQVPVVAEMVAGHVGRPLLVDGPATVVALGAITGLAAAPAHAGAPSADLPTTAAAAIAPAVAAATVAGAAAASASPSTDTPSIASAPRETAMSDQPASDTTPAATSGGAGGRSIPTPPPPPGKKVSSKMTTVAGGLAAVAAAITAAVFFGDDVVDAFDGPNGDANSAGIADAPAADTRTADRAEREATDDSMDAFDAVDPSAAAAAAPTAGAAAAVGTPLAPPPQDQQSFDRPAPRQAPQHQQERPQFDDGGPDPAPRHMAPPAAAAAEAAAAGAAAAGAASVGSDTNSDFEASRAQLLARLDAFEAPEGTSPEDAQALKAELRETIENFDPQPGQSTADAMATLRDQFDDTVQDFTQDQQIDALIEEVQRDNDAEAAADAAPADPVAPPVDDADDADDADEPGATTNPPDDADDPGAIQVTDADDPSREGTPDGTPSDADATVTDANNDGLPDEGESNPPSDESPIDPTLTDPTLDQTRYVEVDGESTDDRHRGEVDAAVSDDDATPESTDDSGGDRPDTVGARVGVEFSVPTDLSEVPSLREEMSLDLPDVNLPVAEDPDAGGEIASRLDDGFDDLVAVVSDPDMGGEATPGAVIGGAAIPQVRATLDPDAARPTMMDDLGDDTYEQVKAAADVDVSVLQTAVAQDPPDMSAIVDAPLLEPVLEASTDLAPVIPEPEPIQLDIDVPISVPDESDFEEQASGLAEDLSNDITPNAPDNLQFGG